MERAGEGAGGGRQGGADRAGVGPLQSPVTPPHQTTNTNTKPLAGLTAALCRSSSGPGRLALLRMLDTSLLSRLGDSNPQPASFPPSSSRSIPPCNTNLSSYMMMMIRKRTAYRMTIKTHQSPTKSSAMTSRAHFTDASGEDIRVCVTCILECVTGEGDLSYQGHRAAAV